MEAGDVIHCRWSGEYFKRPELDLLDRHMSECGWFPQILQDLSMPFIKYVYTDSVDSEGSEMQQL